MRIDELDNLLDMEFINVYKNILINGDWGVGKTKFIKQYVNNKDSIYISLFGINDIESVKINIYMQLNKALGFLKKINKKIEGVNFGISIGSISIPYFETDIVSKLAKKTNNKLIIIIDDLERKSANIPMEEILGLIEELNGIKGIYVIVICNEKEIEKTNKQDKKIYDSFKEKVIQKTFNITGYSMQARKNIINNILQKMDNIDDKEDCLRYIEDFFDQHNVLNLRTIEKSMKYMKFVLLNFDICKLKKVEVRNIVIVSLSIVVETIEKIYYKQPTKDDLKDALYNINDLCNRIISNYFKESPLISDKRFIVSTLIDIYEDKNINTNFHKLMTYYENEHLEDNKASLFYKSKNELEKTFLDFYNNSIIVANESLDIDLWLKKYAEIKYYAKIIGIDNIFEKSKVENAIDKYIDNIPNIESEIQKNRYRLYNLDQYKDADIKELCVMVNKKVTKKFNEVLINELKNDKNINQYEAQKILKLFQQNDFNDKADIQYVIDLLYENKFFLPDLNGTLTEKSWSFTHSIWNLMKDYKDSRDNKFEKYVVELLENVDEVGKYRIEYLNEQYSIDISNL